MPAYRLGEIGPVLEGDVFIAPTAVVIGNVKLGRGSSVWFQTVLRGDTDRIEVGENTNIQDITMCHADQGMPTLIGDRVTIGHRCVIHGCRIEDECLIGMGAIVMNGAVIGRGSMVAAGSVVLEGAEIPPFSMVAGIPGKIKRTHGEEMAAMIKLTAEFYKALADRYRTPGGLKRLDDSP